MKKTKILSIMLVAFLCCSNSCNDQKYPISLGKQTLVGKIIGMRQPPAKPDPNFPPVPCLLGGLETDSCQYYLMIDSHYICGKLVVDNVEYILDDEVEVIGKVTIERNKPYEEYFIIEIETIKKLP